MHLIIVADKGNSLSDILRDFKKFTSKEIIKTIKEWLLNLFWYTGKNNKKVKYYKVWQDGNEAKEIHTAAF